MGLLKLTINTREASAVIDDMINPIANDISVVGRLAKYMQGLKARGGSFLNYESGGTQSSGTLTVAPNAADGDTVAVPLVADRPAQTVGIGQRLAEEMKPKWLRIGGYWYPRGGIPIDVFWQTGAPPEGLWVPDQGVQSYRGRG